MIDISLDHAKRMTVLLYDVPTAADKDARTIMDAADLVLAQQAKIARLQNKLFVAEMREAAEIETNARLRAALEEIVNWKTAKLHWEDIARKALAKEEVK